MNPNDGSGNGNGRGKPNRGITRDEELMIRTVRAMFFHGGVPTFRSHREVAAELGLNVPAVSALIEAAFANDLFAVLPRWPREKADVVRLEDAVKRRYRCLKKVLLVPGLPEVLEDLDQAGRRHLHTQVILAMAQRVREHLDELIAEAAAEQRTAARAGREFEPLRIGVPWGRTMNLLAQYLRSNPPEHRALALEVLSIIGSTATLREDPIESSMVATNMAVALGGRARQLPCPAFLPPDQAEYISEKVIPVHRMLERIVNLSVVITSMGPIPENVSSTDITLSSNPAMNDRLYKEAREAGAIGEICYWLFNRQGKEVTTGHKGMGLGFDGLRAVAERGQVILVVGGDKWRFEPLKVALEAGLASVLVSDTFTARYLVDELEMEDATMLPRARPSEADRI